MPRDRSKRVTRKEEAEPKQQPLEPPSMLSSFLSKSSGRSGNNNGKNGKNDNNNSLVESSLLILDAYEHRLRHGQNVPATALTDLRMELDRQPPFAGSLDVTLRLLDLQEKVQRRQRERQQQERTSTTTTTMMTPGRGRTAKSVGTTGREPLNSNQRKDHQDQDDDLTSLRPPTPGPFQKSSVTSLSPSGHHRRPSSHIYSSPPPASSPPLSPWSHDSEALLRKQRERQRMLPDWYDDDNDDAEEEVVDEAELARRRAQVRVRRLPTTSRHPRSSRRAEEEEEYSSSSFFVPTPTSPSRRRRTASPTPTTMTNWQQRRQQPPVQFKDQAMSVVVVPTSDVREEPLLPTRTTTTTSTTRPLPRPRHDTTPYHRHPPVPQSRNNTSAPPIPRSPILPGAPNPDYQVQFKDQAQSLVVTTASSSPHHHHQQDDYVHVPVAIAVPVFDDVETVLQEEPVGHSGRWAQPRHGHRHGRGRVYDEQAFL